MVRTGHVPNWTGYNTSLSKENIPQLSKITYMPKIDPPATELSTINAVLQRSTKIADELGLQYACLVFDEAIHAKIQQIRWKDVTCMDRFVIRMGAFHMAMSFFCGGIAMQFIWRWRLKGKLIINICVSNLNFIPSSTAACARFILFLGFVG